MKDLIKSNIPDQTLELLARNLATAIEQVEPHFTAIPSADKIGIRTMSTSREGYVRLVSGIATEHVNALPRDLDPAVLSAKLTYQQSLVPIKQKLQRLGEMIAEIEIANGVDIMAQSDNLNTALQSARNRNSALDEALSKVDDWNQRYTKREEPPAPTAPAAAETLN